MKIPLPAMGLATITHVDRGDVVPSELGQIDRHLITAFGDEEVVLIYMKVTEVKTYFEPRPHSIH